MNAAAELQTLAAQAAALERAGRWAAAAGLFERIVARVPENADAWYELGRLRRHAGRFDAALAAYAQALARRVSAPEEVHLNRAVIYSDELRRPDDAERELAAALQLRPDYAPALLNLANLHEDRGRREAARTTYERLLALQPEHWEALARLANASKLAPRARGLLLAAACTSLLATAGCGDDGGDGDQALFCERLERLTENDPFVAFGATPTEAEMETAFAALLARAEELDEVAPPAARSAAAAYLDAVERLDELLADAGYGTDVDVRAYREAQTAYVESSLRLERYLTTEC